jgi:hypothetical protein
MVKHKSLEAADNLSFMKNIHPVVKTPINIQTSPQAKQ